MGLLSYSVSEAFHVGRERRVSNGRIAADLVHDMFGVGQLWHPFGRDEAGHLDAFQTRLGEFVHEFDLFLGRDVLLQDQMCQLVKLLLFSFIVVCCQSYTFSFCKPSRGPTSTMVTWAGHLERARLATIVNPGTFLSCCLNNIVSIYTIQINLICSHFNKLS